MFWKFNILTTQIDTLLEKEDVSLLEILDEEDVLQECKGQNTKLHDFLTRPENINQLIDFVVNEPAEENNEKIRYKYPNIACELLTSDVKIITDKLADEEDLLLKVYSFLERDAPANPLLASFVSKVIGQLISRKSEKMVSFLSTRENFVERLLCHIGTSAIMDLLLRLITCIDDVSVRGTCVTWLNDSQLIEGLVSMVEASQPEEKHCNGAQVLCDIVRLGREQQFQLQERAESDPLLNAVHSKENIQLLLDQMLDGKECESVIVNGLQVMQSLLEFRKPTIDGSTEQMTVLDTERLKESVSVALDTLIPRLTDLHSFLLKPPRQHYSQMLTTLGVMDPPLGNCRLQVARLFNSLLSLNDAKVNDELAKIGAIQTLMDLNFQYAWNNFLHTQVEQCLSKVLSKSADEQGSPLLTQLFSEYKIFHKVLEHWENNDQTQNDKKGALRKGFMGHLTKVANHVVDSIEKGSNSEIIKGFYDDLNAEDKERWDTFVREVLSEINKTNTVEWIGAANQHTSSEDDESDFREFSIPTTSFTQQVHNLAMTLPPQRLSHQAFNSYQLQQTTNNFIDQMGYTGDEFSEPEEAIELRFSEKVSSINFDINSADDGANAESLFEQACNERMQQFDDSNNDDEIWPERKLTIAGFLGDRYLSPEKLALYDVIASAPRVPASGRSEDSEDSDSDEDLNSPQVIRQTPAVGAERMDVDGAENWADFEKMTVDPIEGQAAHDVTAGAVVWPGSAHKDSSDQTSDPAVEQGAAWQAFGDTAGSGGNPEVSDGWANFGDFQTAHADDSSGANADAPSPMETTSESSNRAAAYMVNNKNSDDVKKPKVEEPLEGAADAPMNSDDNGETVSLEAGVTSEAVAEVAEISSVVDNNGESETKSEHACEKAENNNQSADSSPPVASEKPTLFTPSECVSATNDNAELKPEMNASSGVKDAANVNSDEPVR